MNDKIEVRIILKKEVWDKALEKLDCRSFLQTWEWSKFQHDSLDKLAFTYGVYEGDEIIGLALSIVEETRFGKFLYSPRGPVCYKKNLEKCLNALVSTAKSDGYIFYRSDPEIMNDDTDSINIYGNLGFKSSANFVQVQRCWIMDLTGITNEDQMFEYAKQNGMSSSIPRHIRKAGKSGVSTRISTDLKDIDVLLELLHELADKKGIPQRPDSYYKDMFKFMAPEGHMKLIIAEYEGSPVSAILMGTFNGEVSTLHGSTKEGLSPNLYIAKKIYWDAIMYAVNNGYNRFNYWGVLSEQQMKDTSHPSFGYSLFKRRMGGKEMLLMDTKDYIIKKIPYIMVYMTEKRRKLKYKVD